MGRQQSSQRNNGVAVRPQQAPQRQNNAVQPRRNTAQTQPTRRQPDLPRQRSNAAAQREGNAQGGNNIQIHVDMSALLGTATAPVPTPAPAPAPAPARVPAPVLAPAPRVDDMGLFWIDACNPRPSRRLLDLLNNNEEIGDEWLDAQNMYSRGEISLPQLLIEWNELVGHLDRDFRDYLRTPGLHLALAHRRRQLHSVVVGPHWPIRF